MKAPGRSDSRGQWAAPAVSRSSSGRRSGARSALGCSTRWLSGASSRLIPWDPGQATSFCRASASRAGLSSAPAAAVSSRVVSG